MLQKIKELIEKTKLDLEKIVDLSNLNEIKVRVFGKTGELTNLSKGMRDVPNEEKPKGYKSAAAKQAFKDILKDKDMKVTVDCGNYTIKMNVILTDLILNTDE